MSAPTLPVNGVSISFEFFPPKTDRARESLWETVDILAGLKPDFMTVTYGAGGSTRAWTIETAARILKQTGLPTAAHLTCIATPRQEIAEIAETLWQEGVRHIVALRGDAPADIPVPAADDPAYYRYSSHLVEGLLALHPFEISVAAYPDKHPEAPSLDADISALKLKCAAGAHRAITQFFFDNDTFYRFRDKIAAAGISKPLVAGILPLSNFEKAAEFAEKCGTFVPDSLRARFEGLTTGSEPAHHAAQAFLEEQITDLLAHGVDHFHFYTLNQAPLTAHACQILGQKTRP